MTSLLNTPLPKLIEKATKFRLSPTQTALIEIGCGRRVQDLTGEVRQAAVHALGYEHGPVDTPRVLLLNKGARGGGTMLAAYLAAYRGLTCSLAGMAPGEECRVGFLSASMRQARQGLRYARGFVHALGLDSIVEGDTQHHFSIRREGRLVEFSLLRGSTGGDVIAGSWWAALAIHEMAIATMPSSGAQPLDIDSVERAARPRLLPARGRAPAGLILEETTSGDAAGPAYDRAHDNFAKPNAPITIFRATSTELQPDNRALQRHIDTSTPSALSTRSTLSASSTVNGCP